MREESLSDPKLKEQFSDVLLVSDSKKKEVRIVKGIGKDKVLQTVVPDKKNESQLIRSLASKDDRNYVLMYTLKEPSYWKQTYCFINNSNSNKWDPALTAYIHHGYDNFHEDDFTKYINIVANDVKIKDKYNPNIIYNESDDTFDFEYRWNSGDKGIIASKDIINELFLGIKNEKYNCTIIVGYPQDLTKIIDALKRDNFFKLEYLPLQGKLRKVSDLNKKYDQVVKIWKEYYEDERKRQAMKNQANLKEENFNAWLLTTMKKTYYKILRNEYSA